MIQSLEGANFQSWKKVFMEFDPHVNIIVGSSDSGKTAILRMLNWIAFNKPAGDAFRRWDTKDTEAEIVVDDISISRKKGKSGNTYTLNGMELASFGQGVPPNVEVALNLSDINIQKQLDAPFLISMSAADISRKLNELAKLDVIDTSSSNANSLIRQNKQDITVRESQNCGISEQLLTYKNLGFMETEFDIIGGLADQLDVFQRESSSIQHLVTELEAAEQALTNIPDMTGAVDTLQDIIVLQNNHITMRQSAVTLSSLNHSTMEQEQTLQDIPDTADAMEEMGWLEEKTKELREMQSHHGLLLSNVNYFETRSAEFIRLEDSLVKLQAEFVEAMPDVCPLCETELKYG